MGMRISVLPYLRPNTHTLSTNSCVRGCADVHTCAHEGQRRVSHVPLHLFLPYSFEAGSLLNEALILGGGGVRGLVWQPASSCPYQD